MKDEIMKIVAELTEEIGEKEILHNEAKRLKEAAGKYSPTYYKHRDRMTYISGEIWSLKAVVLNLKSTFNIS